MKTIAALVLSLFLAASPYAAIADIASEQDIQAPRDRDTEIQAPRAPRDSGLPWGTFSETVKDASGARQGGCAGEPILVVQLSRGGVDYLYFAAESGRFVFAEMGGDKPVKIYVGEQLPAPQNDVIRILDAHPFSETRDGDGPCGHLFPNRS